MMMTVERPALSPSFPMERPPMTSPAPTQMPDKPIMDGLKARGSLGPGLRFPPIIVGYLVDQNVRTRPEYMIMTLSCSIFGVTSSLNVALAASIGPILPAMEALLAVLSLTDEYDDALRSWTGLRRRHRTTTPPAATPNRIQ